MLTLQWNDTQKARHCNADGDYQLHWREDGGVNAQEILIKDIWGVYEGKYNQ